MASPNTPTPPANPLRLQPDQIMASIPPALGLGQIFFVTQSLYAVVKAKIPNAIGADTLTVPEINERLTAKVDEKVLLRLLRLLAQPMPGSMNMFKESQAKGTFAFSLTTTGALLQTGVEGQPSLACGIHHWSEPFMWNSWAEIPDLLMGKGDEGKSPFVRANNKAVWDVYTHDSESGSYFHEFMSFFSAGEKDIVTNFYDWTPFAGKTFVDIGGSMGDIAEAVKTAQPGLKEAINFDLPDVVKQAPSREGVTNVGGDMFDASTLPKDAGVIFMKHILHDWSDEKSVEILTSCEKALAPGGVVVIADSILPDAGEESPCGPAPFYLDALMMLIGGNERTEHTFANIAAQAGLKVKSVVRTPSPACQLVTLERA